MNEPQYSPELPIMRILSKLESSKKSYEKQIEELDRTIQFIKTHPDLDEVILHKLFVYVG